MKESPGSGTGVPSAHGLRRRGITTLADQAVSSLTNFGVSFMVFLAVASAADFGSFTLAYITYLLMVNVNRGLVSDPLAIRFSGSAPGREAAVADAVGAALGVGLAGGAVIVAASVAVGGATGSSLLAVGCLLPLLLAQDTWRFAFFTAGTPGRALANDAVWGAGQFAGIGIAIAAASSPSVAVLVWIWAGTGALAGLFGVVQSSILPHRAGLSRWLSVHRDLGIRLAVESLISRGSDRLSLFVIAGVTSLTVLGSLNGARVLFGPLNVLNIGLFAFAIPEGVRLAERDDRSLPRVVVWLSIGLAALALAVGGALLAVPDSVGTSVMGGRWQDISPYLLPVAIVVAATGWITAHRVGLRVLAAARESLAVEVLTGPSLILGGAVGAAVSGGVGAAVGLAVAQCFGAVAWTFAFHRVRRRT